MYKKLITEIKNHKYIYTLLAIIMYYATYFRVWRTNDILHFFYDQGRDALEIWELIHEGDFFLIGPTTGIAGIFRGPFYYYLITPFYWLGGGNPVYPAVFLSLTTIAAIVLGFYLSKLFKDRTTGIFFATISGFSFYLIYASRWLSNPTPMLLLSMIFVFSLYLIMNGRQWAWILLSFIAGNSLFHFGSSGEFFYFPAIGLFSIWQYWPGSKKIKFPSLTIILLSIVAFLSTLLPLIIFDLRNDFLLFNNIKAFLFERGSFKSGFLEVLENRFDFYKSVFWGKIFPSTNIYSQYAIYGITFLFLYRLNSLLENKYFKLLSILLISPVVGLLFFQGNQGNIYDYYMTGYYFIWTLFLSLVLREIWSFSIGKLFVVFFLFVFLNQNIPINRNFVNDYVDGPNTIAFLPQKQAIEWVYSNAYGSSFNVDVYVPPVIPYSYDYLFTWYESKPEYTGKIEERSELLYTLYEEDPPNPERLDAWLQRQDGIGEVLESSKFAGITVQRRKRL